MSKNSFRAKVTQKMSTRSGAIALSEMPHTSLTNDNREVVLASSRTAEGTVPHGSPTDPTQADLKDSVESGTDQVSQAEAKAKALLALALQKPQEWLPISEWVSASQDLGVDDVLIPRTYRDSDNHAFGFGYAVRTFVKNATPIGGDGESPAFTLRKRTVRKGKKSWAEYGFFPVGAEADSAGAEQ